MSMVFAHTPLKDAYAETRFLTLGPNLDYSAPIECDLEVSRIANCPSFQAISYHWANSASLSKTIHVKGKRLLVTASLDSALRDLRDPYLEKKIWIDGVCIDQSIQAGIERGVQVARMGDIFSSADRVVAWLNGDYKAFREVFGFFNDLASSNRSLNEQYESFEAFDALTAFTSLPWWSRVWVFQEVVVAKDLLLVCGNLTMSWDVLCIAANKFIRAWEANAVNNEPKARHPPTPTPSFQDHSLMWRRWSVELGTKQAFRRMFRQKTLPSLAVVLSSQRGKDHGATDPRDRVYALLRLSSEFEAISSRLKIDYAQTVIDVYRDVTRLVIDASGETVLLSLVRTYDCEISSPSWVPDWRCGSEGEDVSAFGEWSLFNAARGMRAVVCPVTSNNTILPILGFEATSIADLFSTSLLYQRFWPLLMIVIGLHLPLRQGEDAWKSIIDEQAPIDWDILKSKESEKGSCASDAEELFEDLLDLVRISCRDTLHTRSGVRRLRENELRALFAHLVQTTDMHSVLAVFPALQELQKRCETDWNNLDITGKGAITLTFQRLQGNFVGNSIARTLHGTLSMVPKGTKEGDILAVLLGGRTPYVLRKEGSQFRLIGNAYVPKMMEGEIIDAADRHEKSFQTFRLI